MRRCNTSLILSLLGFVSFSTVYIYMKGIEYRRRENVEEPRSSFSSGQQPKKGYLDSETNQRREFIKSVKKGQISKKNMMKDAWDQYVKDAWGQNELQPISQRGHSGGSIYGDYNFGATIIDSLDTLFIMGFNKEFKKAKDWTATNLKFSHVDTKVSLFETNIRILGGLLSAYALTNDKIFANKAIEVGKRLLPAFETPSGIPSPKINPATGEIERGGTIALAELGSLHLEFVYLSKISGHKIFAEKVLKIQQVMNKLVKPNGLYFSSVRTDSGTFSGGTASMGGGSDSFYEYLLKAFVQTGDMTARKMYDNAMNAFVKNGLVRTSKKSHLLYIAESRNGMIFDVGSHLECFAGGMFALGSVTDPRNFNESNRERDLEIGRNFTNTCHESYIKTKTRIGPEEFIFLENRELETINPSYILRPEVIESYFVLYRLTGDSKYRDWGWDAAQAIQKYCKVAQGGYSGIRNVNSGEPRKDDVQQTFFLAETLKYLYLLFSPPDVIGLNKWVFNTEAHPLPILWNNPLF